MTRDVWPISFAALNQREGQFDPRLAKALAHPFRLRILQVLNKRIASPAVMAKLLELPLGTVSYHTQVLLEADCIELVKTEPKRGALEHFYRARPHSSLGSRDWQKVPESLRDDLTAAALDGFYSSVIRALQASTFRRQPNSTLIWQPLTVDEEGWGRIIAILREAEAKIQSVAEECANRIDNPDSALTIVTALSAFEAAESK